MKTHRSKQFLLSLPFRYLILSLLVFGASSLILSTNLNSAFAADVTFAWDPSPEPEVVGYKLYYGITSGTYDHVVDAGNNTTLTITGLEDGVTYYSTVTAYDSLGNESAPAEELSFIAAAEGASGDSADGGGGGGCFIATAAFGSYLAPEVMVLREFRDRYLLPNALGAALVRFYYSTSPPIADFIREHENLRTFTRWALTPVVYGVKYPLSMFLTMCIVIGGLYRVKLIRDMRRAKAQL